MIPASIHHGLVLALLSTAAWAQAAVLYTLPAPTAALASPAAVADSFAAGAGAGSLHLQVQGYASLDGDHFWIDILTVSLNGSDIFSGTWNLGGGGSNRVLLAPADAVVTHDSGNRTVAITLPVTLLAGSNQFAVAYDSPTLFEGISRSGPQGLSDEGWGLNALDISGPAAVPEPATALMWALALIVGAGPARRAARRGARSAVSA